MRRALGLAGRRLQKEPDTHAPLWNDVSDPIRGKTTRPVLRHLKEPRRPLLFRQPAHEQAWDQTKSATEDFVEGKEALRTKSCDTATLMRGLLGAVFRCSKDVDELSDDRAMTSTAAQFHLVKRGHLAQGFPVSQSIKRDQRRSHT